MRDVLEKLPADPQCTYRYIRGGVYSDEPAQVRSAAKNCVPPDDKISIENHGSAGLGFKVARDL